MVWGDREREAGDIGIWFLYKGSNFDVGRVYSPAGEFRGYYADAVEMIDWQGSDPRSLAPIVDLFLDIWIWPDGRYEILDEDELADALRQRYVSAGQAELAHRTIGQIAAGVEAGSFPPVEMREFQLLDSDLAELQASHFRPRPVHDQA